MCEWTIEISTATALVLCSHHALYLRGCDCVDRVLHRRAAARPPEGPQRRHRGAGGRVTVPCRCVHAVMLCCQVCGVLLSPACRQADTHADRQTDRHTHTHTHTDTHTCAHTLVIVAVLLAHFVLAAARIDCALCRQRHTRSDAGRKTPSRCGRCLAAGAVVIFSPRHTHRRAHKRHNNTSALTNNTITRHGTLYLASAVFRFQRSWREESPDHSQD